MSGSRDGRRSRSRRSSHHGGNKAEPQAQAPSVRIIARTKGGRQRVLRLAQLVGGRRAPRPRWLLSIGANEAGLKIGGRAVSDPEAAAAQLRDHPEVVRRLERVAEITGAPQIAAVVEACKSAAA